MELRHLQAFVSLAEEGSFTRAAQRMHIVQSALSTSIRELEQELGVQLVERTTRVVSLNEQGRLFLDYVRSTLGTLDAGIAAIRSQNGQVRGRLTLGMIQSLPYSLDLPAVLEEFRSLYPDVSVTVRTVSNDVIPKLVKSGELDLSFYVVVDKTHWAGLEMVPYSRGKMVAVCSKRHRLSNQKSISLAALSRESFIDLTPERALRIMVDKVFSKNQFDRTTVYEVTDIQTLLHFVNRSLGVALVPSFIAGSPSELQLSILNIGGVNPRWLNLQFALLKKEPQKGHLGGTLVDIFLEFLKQKSASRLSRSRVE